MKMTLLPMLSFLILFVLPLFQAAPEPVLDIKGEELTTGSSYYIESAIRGAGSGGVTIGPNRNGTICPRDVVVTPPLRPGFPVKFSPVNPNDGVIQEQTDLSIHFLTIDAYCRRPQPEWKLDDFDEILGRYFITTTNPGVDTLSTWFRIEKSDWAYKLVHCHTVSEKYNGVCGDIGIFRDDNGVRRLAISPSGDNQPFRVVFAKA